MIRSKVTVDTTAVVKDIENLLQDEDTRTLIQANFAQAIDPYVPYDTGYLSQQSVEIDASGVTYTADYAWRQYYGEEFHHKTEVHPLATAFWDEVAMSERSDEILARVRDVIVGRYNNGQE